jgi:hypothetical protein
MCKQEYLLASRELSPRQRCPSSHDEISELAAKVWQLMEAREQVAPGVCVSGEKVARDRELLRRSGITHVVNCVGMLVPECFPNDFRYLTLYLRGEASFYQEPLQGSRWSPEVGWGVCKCQFWF